jgi:hypothetical protein
MLDETSVKKVDDAVKTSMEQDHRMQVSNTQNLIPETMNVLLPSLLNQIIYNWKAENRAEMDADKQSLLKLLAIPPLAANLTKSFQTDDRSMVEKLLGSRASRSPSSQQASSSKSETANPLFSQTNSASKSVSEPPVVGLDITRVDNASRSTLEGL